MNKFKTYIKIINFIQKNGYITNTLSRENLGLGKTKSAKLFKKLVKLNKIEKVGAGPRTKYILKK